MSRRARDMTVVLALMMGAFLGSKPAMASNEDTTIIFHARSPGPSYWCVYDPPPFDCSPGNGPQLAVQPGELVEVYLYLRNYDDIKALSCRLAVDGGSGAATWGDWTLLAFGTCGLPGQLVPEAPNRYSEEPGNLFTNFYCLRGGELRAVCYVMMVAGTTGCLGVEEHIPWGTGVIPCPGYDFTPIPPGNRGRVCIGPGGYDACDPQPVPVENETWGRIKKQYGGR